MSEGSAALLAAARAGDARALGRLVTIAERGGAAGGALDALACREAGEAWVLGITGAPGAGKSTLTGLLAAGAGGRAAVLAVDPSSPRSGGAILGDRVRMDPALAERGVFIRSMATRGHGGGLSLAVPAVVRVLAAAGVGTVIVETAGVGQVELEIAAAADTTVVVVTPGWGDAVQANKAGILEVADLLVVNKADRPGAGDARRDLELMLDLGGALAEGAWRPPILATTATENRGVRELWAAARDHREWLARSGGLSGRRADGLRAEIRQRVVAGLSAALDEALRADAAPMSAVLAGRLAPTEAAAELLRRPWATA